MNLTVEWVHFGDFVQGPGTSDDYIPIIRVATLMRWIEAQERYDIGLDYLHKQLRELLAQLPEDGS